MLWVAVGGVGGWPSGWDLCHRYMTTLLTALPSAVALRKRERHGSTPPKMNSTTLGSPSFRITPKVTLFTMMKSSLPFQLNPTVIIQRYTGTHHLKLGAVLGHHSAAVVGRQYLNTSCLDLSKSVCSISSHRIHSQKSFKLWYVTSSTESHLHIMYKISRRCYLFTRCGSPYWYTRSHLSG